MSVVLLDKEDGPPGTAASNSGVLHAGFYYTADSLKARFTRAGNLAWTDYCRERKLPLRACGKLVVASSPEDLPVLDELLKRGSTANGVPGSSSMKSGVREIEPRAKTLERALFSSTTAVVDPVVCLAALAADAEREGVELRWSTAYRGASVASWDIMYGRTAGGFRGERGGPVRRQGRARLRLLAALPHTALQGALSLFGRADGRLPRARLSRAGYPQSVSGSALYGDRGRTREDRSDRDPGAVARELRRTRWVLGVRSSRSRAVRPASFYGAGFDFRRLAWEEIQKNSKRVMTALAGRLVEGVKPEDYRRWGKPGIRAQLVNIETKTLVMDFVLEGDGESLHVLNAVSPGFTCAMPFAAHVCDRVEGMLKFCGHEKRSAEPSPAPRTSPALGGLGIEAFASWYRERIIEQWNRLDLAALAKIVAVIERARPQAASSGCAATAARPRARRMSAATSARPRPGPAPSPLSAFPCRTIPRS